MIPKVIHYCWFGRHPLPAMAKKCIKSWKKYLPDYEIKEWNEDNFDVNMIPYTQEAYQAKKYAFVSDYARFWIIYNFGGIYFDTDVEVIRSLKDIIDSGSFMGCQRDVPIAINPGLGIGAPSGLAIYKEMLGIYDKEHFINPDKIQNYKTIVHYTTDLFIKHGLSKKGGRIQRVDGVTIYPKEYFCPLDPLLKMEKTRESRTIHHFDASWQPFGKQLIKKIKRMLGYRFSYMIRSVLLKIGFIRSRN